MKNKLKRTGKSNPFRPGDIVVCVDANYAGNFPHKTYPKMNCIYTIRGLFDDCVWLEEIVNAMDLDYNIEPMWFHWHFIKLEEMVLEDQAEYMEEVV